MKNYWICGKHSVLAALNNPKRRIVRIIATKNNEKWLLENNIEAKKLEILHADKISQIIAIDALHQGIAVLAEPLPEMILGDLLEISHSSEGWNPAKTKTIVVLDEIMDPHNFGAIMRTAAAFGAVGIVATSRNSAVEGAVLAKAASGALDIVPIVRVNNLAHALDEMKEAGYWLAGLDMDGENIRNFKPAAKTAIVMGSEGQGIRRLTRDKCDYILSIPISSVVESLNVSNAAAIALYALCNQ